MEKPSSKMRAFFYVVFVNEYFYNRQHAGENLHKDPGFRTSGSTKNYFLYIEKP